MDYSAYYLSEIVDERKGFKPVYGATGLGKTYGIRKAIQQVLAQDRTKKFIYITNRHALIQELADSLQGEDNIPVAYLKADEEVIRDLFKAGKLGDIANELIEKDFFKYHEQNDKGYLKEWFRNEISGLKSFENIIADHRQNRSIPKHIKGRLIKETEQQIHNILRRFSNLFKQQFYLLKKANGGIHEQFLNDNAIWELFPYIRFEHDPDTPVLLGTIHKFCRGYFDGKKRQKLPDIQDKIIFLDEFDFLENEILNIICEEPQINNPIEFVRFFYEEFQNWKDSDFWEQDNDLQYVKQQMTATFEYLNETIEKYGLEFPQLRQFTFHEEDFDNEQQFLLFQNNRTILSERFYLNQGATLWEIVKEEDAHTVRPLWLFSMLKSSIEQMLRTFDRIRDRPHIIDGIVHHIWNTKNDNVPGAYNDYVKENFLYKKTDRGKWDFDNPDFGYNSGFSLITIAKGNSIDPRIADIEQIELITSPEAVLVELANRNLVFGLSATGDIPRMVKSFNMQWITENTQFIEPTQNDKMLIEELKQQKAQQRKREIAFCQNKELEEEHPLFTPLKQLKEIGFYADEQEDANSKASLNRFTRTLKFFGCVDWILNESQNRTHLIFLTTFNREKHIVDGDVEDIVRAQIERIIDIHPQRLADDYGNAYKVRMGERACNLVFLNAEAAKKIEETGHYQEYDQLFADHEVDKVILVTQYQTASNGRNLRCLGVNGNEQDFEGIHLLEACHFWFDTDKEHYLDNKKKVFWYFWKLMRAGEISYNDFRRSLKRTDLKAFNSKYKLTNEYTFNSIALFYQALGRVDRKKEPTPPVEMTFSEDVLAIFRDFLMELRYASHPTIANRESYSATLIVKLHKQLKKFFNLQQVKADLATFEDVSEKNATSRKVIRTLLDEIEKIKTGTYNERPETVREIMAAWRLIRESVLRQDYNAVIEFEHAKHLPSIHVKQQFVHETAFMQAHEQLLMSLPELHIYPQKVMSENQIIIRDLNRPYRVISNNDFLREQFSEMGFSVGYKHTEYPTKPVFTPYIEQAILQGAIGEEAIKMLLRANGVYLENEEKIPAELFEVFDAKLKHVQSATYIDFKNFSANTLDKFALTEEDWEYDEQFDALKFATKVKNRLARIKRITHEQRVRYVVINFVADSENRTSDFFTEELQRVSSYAECDIAIIPGVLDGQNNNTLTKEFETFLGALKAT